MNDVNWSWGETKPVSEIDWRKEADIWFHKYLAVRRRNRNLIKQLRYFRGLACRLLLEK